MRQYYCILIFSIIIFSCKKNSTSNIAGSEYFPNSVGNYWRYKYVDSVSNKSVSVDVNITGNKVLPGGQAAKIWTYVFPDHTDTSFVYQTGDTIRFVDPSFSIRNTYIVPLQINATWRTNPDYVYDSITVIANQTYNLNGKSFENSFLLSQYGHLPNQQWKRSEWFSPKIGMIIKNETTAFYIAGTFTNTYWELVSYNLR